MQHIDPNADNANTLVEGVGVEEPHVPTSEDAWLDAPHPESPPLVPFYHRPRNNLRYSPSPEDHVSIFSPEDAQPAISKPSKFWDAGLNGAPFGSKDWSIPSTSVSTGHDSTATTESSALSTMTTPRYQVDFTIDNPLQGYTTKTVVSLVKDCYTQVSTDHQDSGFGRFGMPYELSKVIYSYKSDQSCDNHVLLDNSCASC